MQSKIKSLEEKAKADEEKNKTVVDGLQAQIKDMQKMVENAKHVSTCILTVPCTRSDCQTDFEFSCLI